MAQTIKIKRSGTSGNKLTGSNSIAGEIGMNTADKSLYIQTGSADADVVTVYDDSILHLDDTNNRVGIGTTSPQATLDVIGTGKFRGSSADDGVVLALGQMESPNSTTPLFEFRTNDVGTDQLEIRGRRYEAITRFSRGSAAGAGVSMAVLQRSFPGADVHGTAFSLFEQADSSASGSTATTVKIRLDSSGSSYFNGGNVGIGTTAPANSLEIATSNPTIRLRDTDTGARTTLSAASGVGGFILNVDSGNSVANSYIDFKLDNTTRMYVNGSGNVGIGTSSPSRMLHLNGSSPAIRLQDTDLSGYAEISANDTNSGITFNADPTNSQANTLFAFRVDNSERMRIDSAGNVGIGTTSPTTPLAVQSNSSAQGISILGRSSDDISQLDFNENDGTSIGGIQARTTDFRIRSVSNIPLIFMTNNTQRVQIHNNGQLGIGVTDFTNALRGAGKQLIIGSCFVGTAAALVADDFARFGGGLYIHEDAGTNKANQTSIDNDGDRLVITGKQGTTANALSAPDGFYIGSTQFITSSRNLVNIGTISSGAITTSGTLDFTANPAYIRNDEDNSGQIIISAKNSSGSAQQVRWDVANASSGAWRPEVTNVSNLGLTNRIWNTLYVNNIRMGSGNNQFVDASRNITAGTISSGNITTTGYLRGPSTFTIDPAAHGDNSGTVVIAGNLQVDGTTTTINSTTMTVDDKNITLASGSTNKAAANGAGLTVDCGSDTDATFTYDGTNDEWDFNKALNVTGGIEASGPSAFKYGLTSSVTGNTSEYPLDIGSTGATNFVIQRWQTNYGYKSFIIAYGSQHSSQAGNFAIKNTQTGKDIYFQLANSVEPLRLTSTGATFAGTISSGAITATGTSTLSGLSINSAFTFPTSDGSTNQVLKTDGSGNVTWATEAATSASTSMSDADGDTKIQVEESADEDLIRFDVAGTERFRIGSDVQVMGTTDFNITGSNRRINFTSGTGTVRTSGASSLNLGTSNTDRMTITSAGNVGIGTTSPETKLDVIVDSNSAYTSTMSGVPSYTPSASDVIQVKNTESGVDNIYAGIWFETGNPATNTTGSDRTGRIALVVDNDTSYASNFVFQTRGSAGTLTEKMRITEGGNVGIGATNPSNQFVIKSGTGVDMEFGSEPTAAFIQTYNRTSSAYGHLRFVTNGETMRLTNTGSVGIGTTSPSQKLQVAGTILADTALTASSSTTAIGIGSESNISDGNSTYKTKLITENNNAKLTTYQYGSYLTLKAGVSGTGYSNNWSKIELRDGGAAGSNNAHMKFYTHGDERMVIDTNGNVGIGTTSPIAPLHITNSSTSTPTLLLGKNQTNGVTLLGDDYISGENYVTLGMDYSSNSLMLGAAVKVSSTASRTLVSSQDGYAAKGAAIYVDGYGGAIDFYTSNSSAVRTTGAENTNIANRMRIDSAGNVGIGYSSPNYKLDISATGNGINLGGTGAFLRWNSGDMQIKNEGSYAMGFYTYNSSDAALNRRMIIDTNGNVGIGTTSPNAKLQVVGNITAGNSSTSASIRAHYSDGSYTTLEGYGLEMNRGASYIRPTTDGDKTLYFGMTDDSRDWASIRFRSTAGLYLNGSQFIDASRNLTNIGTISSANITTSHLLTINQNQQGVRHIAPDVMSGHTSRNEMTSSWTADETRWYMFPTVDGSSNFGRELSFNYSTEEWSIEGPVTLTSLSTGNITTTGYLRGPSTFTIDPAAHGDDTGTVVIAGNLQVDGTTTTINSTTLTVDDLNITLASGAANAAAANGAGITVDIGSGTNPAITYVSSGDQWKFNKELVVEKGSSAIAFDEYNNGATIWLDGSNGDFTGGDYFNISAYGTTDLAFGYGAATKITMKNDGKLGIGTSSPDSLLHLKSTGDTRMTIESPDANDAYINFSGATDEMSLGFDKSDAAMYITNHGTITANRRVTIKTTGKVGIGTTAPSAPLSLLDASLTTNGTGEGGLRVHRPNAASQYGYFDYGYNGGGVNIGSLYSGGGAASFGTFTFRQHSSTTSQIPMFISSTGNVGIGTTSPAKTLDVAANGTNQGIHLNISNVGRLHMYADGDRNYFNGLSGNGHRFTTTGGALVEIQNGGNVGIGTTSPDTKLDITTTGVHGLIINQDTSSANVSSRLFFKDSTRTNLIMNVSGRLEFRTDGTIGSTSGTYKVGVTPTLFDVTTPIRIEETEIGTTTTSTSATTQVAIDAISATVFRSVRYTIQVTNSTDSTYHLTEVLLIHNGTTPQITEYGTIFTGSAEATFDADISSGNVRLLATPATTDSMTFKVVRHCITV